MILLKSFVSSLPLSTLICNRTVYRLKHFIRSVKRTNPSADRNSQPIADALRCQLNRDKKNLQLLEIASGTGQHAGFLASLFPNIIFQPSEVDPVNLPSIKAYSVDCATKNMREPLLLDVSQNPTEWKPQLAEASFDYMLNINMIHISEWNTSIGLFRAAGYLLKPHGKLFTYGPYAEDGVLTPASNVMFNESLKTRNPAWGVRDIVDLNKLARANGLQLTQKLNMPANNKTLTWTKM